MDCLRFFAAFFLLFCSAIPVGAVPWQDALADKTGFEATGFIDVRAGTRLQNDPHEDDASLAETRIQLKLSREVGRGWLTFKGDLVADGVEEEVRAELREMNFSLSPLDWTDVKVGRQVLTWGTGDLLFINDLFPKDWVAFFSGRDDEYLKAPADAVKVSVFSNMVNVDLAYMPLAGRSEYISGSRLSYWNGSRLAGASGPFLADASGSVFTTDELAVRLHKNLAGVELALYGFSGYWKTPEGIDPANGHGVYPRLNVWGGSARGAFLGGIANLEAGYYLSPDDRDGGDPLVRNSEIRLLAGFEREIGRDLTGAAQYYQEWMDDYGPYLANLFPGTPAKDEHRHLFTLRLTKLLMGQNLRLSFFIYYSPSDRDWYLRPQAHYKITDQWAVSGGVNLFGGSDDHTFFGQFENNTNAWLGVRSSF